MNFETFKSRSIQLAQVMLAQQDEATKAEVINAIVEQINDAKAGSDEEREAAWPIWSKAVVAACNGDEAGMNECYGEAEAFAAAKPQAAPEPAIKDNGLFWGSMAAGAAMAIVGGPAGWFAGYAVAKAGTAKAMGRF